MQCANHPDTETELLCSRCEKPICPRCLVHTPVGARCRECAGIRRLPTYNIPTKYYAQGGAAALGGGIAIGVAWWMFNIITYFFFGVVAGLAVGYALGELVSLATNRKAGPPLQATAVAGVFVAYGVRTLLLFVIGDWIFDDLRLDIAGLIAVVVACFIAAGRLR